MQTPFSTAEFATYGSKTAQILPLVADTEVVAPDAPDGG